MHPVLPLRMTLAVVAAMLALVVLSARIVQPAWWRSRPFRVATFAAFGAMLLGVGVWALGRGLHDDAVVRVGAGIAYVGVLVLGPAAIATPASAAIDRLFVGAPSSPSTGASPRAASPRDAPPGGAPRARAARLSRRGLIRLGAASLPAAAAITGASGFVTARRAPTTPTIRLRYPGLHPDLDGLRILQLSDLHLGACLGLADLERALRVARDLDADLVVLTGDLADDVALIEPALRMVDALGARHGAFASLGNHEYLHGIEVTRAAYERGPIPLLVAAGTTIRIGRAKMWVGGADDPVHMSGDIAGMLRPSIDAAIRGAPRDADLRVLLCHRPEGFVPATEAGFDLTLSGHTHGGQIGFLGRSLLAKLRPDVFWWGPYARARPRPPGARSREPSPLPSRLYTTSGFGHWFPFRLGCPTEMPLIVLEGASPSRAPRRRHDV